MGAFFYQRVNGSVAAARAIRTIAEAAATAMAAGQVARAAKYDAIVEQLAIDYEQAAVRSALKADELIRQKLDETASGRPRNTGLLRKKIESRPLATPIPLGAIGIGDLDRLNEVINERTGGVYWRAQEWGIDFTGRIVPGYFQPGNSRPHFSEFRKHPYFQQEPYARGMPAMVVTRPIKPRFFLRDGSQLAVVYNLRLRRQAEQKAVAALRSI